MQRAREEEILSNSQTVFGLGVRNGFRPESFPQLDTTSF